MLDIKKKCLPKIQWYKKNAVKDFFKANMNENYVRKFL